MKIIRFVDGEGMIRYGRAGDDGAAHELLAGDLFGRLQPTGGLARAAKVLAPLDPVNIFAVGLNYRAHAEETGSPLPRHPVVFMKPTSAVANPGDPIVLPAVCQHGPEVDYEAELAVVIGRAGKNLPPERALAHVLGYTCAVDVSARRWQKHGGGGQWVRGKSFDTFCPLGPFLVTADEIPDPQALPIRCLVNGRLMQDGSTQEMIFPVAQLISYLSQDTTLLPGTVILTGTPEGVGFSRKPPVFLAPGDRLRVEIRGVGVLENQVVAA
jgi:2-keto-4-pentenoate hydratase/2-oxohepta-3-ene-1,7-dioic acid hydratase in catechol pathway